MQGMIFQDWGGIVRVLIVGVLAYVALIVLLRTSGKRTLAKLNAFDLVITVAIGSTLATILLSEDVALAEGVAAFATLIGLQWLVAWSSVRLPWIARLVRSDPIHLMRDGLICHDALRRERVTEAELMTVIRKSDISAPDRVTAVVLETDGSFSVIGRGPDDAPSDYPRAGLSAPGD